MRWVDSPVIVPPFCGRTRLDVITIGRGTEGPSDGNLHCAGKAVNNVHAALLQVNSKVRTDGSPSQMQNQIRVVLLVRHDTNM